MASQRLIWPAGGSSAVYGTDTALTTPGNVSANDSVFTGSQAVNSTVSIGEKYGNWGWNSVIPAGATITDVQLEYNYVGTRVGGAVFTGHAFARITGTDQADHTDVEAVTFAAKTIGPFTIFADRAWTRADLLDGTFEMVIRASDTNANGFTGVGWDFIAVTVFWTTAAAGDHLLSACGAGH